MIGAIEILISKMPCVVFMKIRGIGQLTSARLKIQLHHQHGNCHLPGITTWSATQGRRSSDEPRSKVNLQLLIPYYLTKYSLSSTFYPLMVCANMILFCKIFI